MTRAKPRKKSAAAATPKAKLSEDWLATAIGVVLILLVRFADFNVKWPLFEWFKK